MKDKRIYFWQITQKTGTVMTLPSITITPMPTVSEKMQPSISPSEQNGGGQNVLSMLEKFKNACKSATVSDTLFISPSDVKFTDMSEIMKQAVRGVPSGMIPSGVSQQMCST